MHSLRRTGHWLHSSFLQENVLPTVQRTTKETDIYVSVGLDGNGTCDISTGLGFFDHMLEQIGKHGGIDLTIRVQGDLQVDEHHTIEEYCFGPW